MLVDLRADLDLVIDALARADAGNSPAVTAQIADAATGALGVLARTIVAGNAGVARIPGKHGGTPRAYAVVTVLVPDVPGELARLLTDVGIAGVNLEDLQLEHASGRSVGMAAISVLPSRSEHLERELTARGWRLAS